MYTTLYIFISVWMTLTFIQIHCFLSNQNFGVHFLGNFAVWMNFSLLPQHVCLLKLMLNLFYTTNIQVKKLCRQDFLKYKIYLRHRPVPGHCQPMCFKHGMMLNTTNLYSLIPAWMTLMFTLGRRVTRKLELVKSFFCKVACSNSIICDSWLWKWDDCEEVL